MNQETKNQVIERLTSSKNERLAFGVIFDNTVEKGKGSKVILNDQFEAAGIAGRKSINAAVNRLKQKGLIFKGKELIHNYAFEVYRYSVIKQGVVIFLNSKGTNENEKL
jgi:hypothetical protein